MKRVLFPFAIPLLAILGAGCSRTSSSSTQDGVLTRPIKAQAIAQAWDRGQRASENNDIDGLVAAVTEMRKLGASEPAKRLSVPAAEGVVKRAGVFYARAYIAPSASKAQLMKQATRLFRQALEIDPEFDSKDSELLNSLGYFLADLGTTQADFKLAEKLTRRSLSEFDARYKQENSGPSMLVYDAERKRRVKRALIQDSLAWSLFKLGRYEQAIKEQRQAVSSAEEALGDSAGTNEALSELYSHLKQIEAKVAASKGS